MSVLARDRRPLASTVGIGPVELTNRLAGVVIRFVGHVGDALRSASAVIAQLQSGDGTNPLKQFLRPVSGFLIPYASTYVQVLLC